MMLTNEDPKTICRLATVLCLAKPKATVVILTDSPRYTEVNYMGGEHGFMRLMQRLGVQGRFQRAGQRIEFPNGSKVDIVPIQRDEDIDRLQGYEAEMFAVDNRCFFTARMLRVLKQRDRSGFTLDDLRVIGEDLNKQLVTT